MGAFIITMYFLKYDVLLKSKRIGANNKSVHVILERKTLFKCNTKIARALQGHLSAIHLLVRIFPCADAPSPPQNLSPSRSWSQHLESLEMCFMSTTATAQMIMPSKTICHNCKRKKKFSMTQKTKLKKFLTTKSALQKILGRILWSKGKAEHIHEAIGKNRPL